MGCTNPAALSFNIARRKAASLKICPHTWDVIRSLRNQIALVRLGQDLNEGKLEYFREAIASSHFHQVVELVKDLLNCALFSTLHEIESMEIAITNHDRTGLIVQCCMILHLCELIACPKWQLSHPAREHPWLFESHGSLEDIAYSRSRLHFVVQASYIGKAIGYSLVYAVEERFREPDSVPKWQDLLLVFRESSAPFLYILLPLLIRVLLREEEEMPREAATLFLSYASDAIYFLANNIGNYVDALEATMIEMLLKRGATPMISREQHHVLFRRLKDQIHTKRAPWWTEAEDFATENHKRFPTALNRFLAHEWELSFLNRLALHTCCSLDATDKFKDNYRVNRVISLRCLAAQNLRESDLDVLSPTQRFIASKHLPNSSFKQYLNLK